MSNTPPALGYPFASRLCRAIFDAGEGNSPQESTPPTAGNGQSSSWTGRRLKVGKGSCRIRWTRAGRAGRTLGGLLRQCVTLGRPWPAGKAEISGEILVEVTGLEPVTFWLPAKRSPN